MSNGIHFFSSFPCWNLFEMFTELTSNQEVLLLFLSKGPKFRLFLIGCGLKCCTSGGDVLIKNCWRFLTFSFSESGGSAPVSYGWVGGAFVGLVNRVMHARRIFNGRRLFEEVGGWDSRSSSWSRHLKGLEETGPHLQVKVYCRGHAYAILLFCNKKTRISFEQLIP